MIKWVILWILSTLYNHKGEDKFVKYKLSTALDYVENIITYCFVKHYLLAFSQLGTSWTKKCEWKVIMF